MNQSMWKRSLPAFALLAFLNADQQLAAADKTNQPSSTAADSKPSSSRANALLARNATTIQKRKGAEAVRKRLQQIVFEDVQADNLPLGAVIQMLIDESRKRDADHIGVNFLIRNSGQELPPAPIDPSTGLPMAGSASEPVDLNAVTIRIMPPLRNVRFIDVLEAMVKVADRPITYSIEDYGVVFSLGSRSRGAQSLETRTFAMNEPPNFFKGIESAFGIVVPNKAPEGSSSAGLSRQTQEEIFEELFTQLGIDWAPPKTAFYNQLTGIFMVRAAEEDMPVISAAMQTLGGGQIGSSTDQPPSSLARSAK